jgi:hypothetical protein
MPIPRTAMRPEFCACKLWRYLIGAWCLNARQGFCPFWDESIAGKGSEERVSWLNKYITTNICSTKFSK